MLPGSRPDSPNTVWALLWPFLGGLLALTVMHYVGVRYLSGFALTLGSRFFPTTDHAAFLGTWAVLGAPAAGLLALGFLRLLGQPEGARLVARWRSIPDRTWLVASALLAFLIPAFLRVAVLSGAPLTDDEDAMKFMARLLAQGRLYAESPPMKLFFDKAFMINDGRYYSQYFLGWPALMVPGVLLGGTGFLNGVLSAATIPPLFFSLRRLVGRSWAKAGTLLYLTSPMIMVAAATEMSHTSCLSALAWAGWLAMRSRDEDAPPWIAFGLSLAFSIGFFIRPSSTLGAGAPIVVYWLLGLRGRPRRAVVGSLAAFAVPAAFLGFLFLAVNKLQNGSWTTTAYQQMWTYAVANGQRFSRWGLDASDALGGFHFGDPAIPVATVGTAALRLAFALFGWPVWIPLVLLARGRRDGLAWASMAGHFAVHAWYPSVGIDSFGPVKYFETAWAGVLLTTSALAHLGPALEGASSRLRHLGPALLGGLVLSSMCVYWPVQTDNLSRMAVDILRPYEAVREAGIRNAVVFSSRPFSVQCLSAPTRHWVFWRPNNDPDLANDVLFVNHVSVEENEKLMAHFPGRTGYVMAWRRDCHVVFFTLAQAKKMRFPDGYVGGTGRIGDEP